MRCWRDVNPVHGFVVDDIVKKIYEINQNYNISYVDGYEKDDIMICKVN